MDALTHALFFLSNGLLVPVIIGLLVATVLAMVQLGALMVSAWRRGQRGPVEALVDGSPLAAALSELRAAPDAEHRQYVIACFEEALAAKLSTARVLTRVGPMLGLMGTLIPLGPALTGLASGDLVTLAENMRVAFATTVVGLLVGGAGFFVAHVGLRWSQADLNAVEFQASQLDRSQAAQP